MYIVLTFFVIYPSKNTSLKMTTIGGRNMWGAALFILQQIYISVYAFVSFVSHVELSVQGHE